MTLVRGFIFSAVEGAIKQGNDARSILGELMKGSGLFILGVEQRGVHEQVAQRYVGFGRFVRGRAGDWYIWGVCGPSGLVSRAQCPDRRGQGP